ncbi:MAG: flagellar basal body P-ring formation protein FlgA [Gammaproteobacteria bacterium]|nr:flagellar basal body P-ring formation protein FlgA [Gammaproteobacteria bacterium]
MKVKFLSSRKRYHHYDQTQNMIDSKLAHNRQQTYFRFYNQYGDMAGKLLMFCIHTKWLLSKNNRLYHSMVSVPCLQVMLILLASAPVTSVTAMERQSLLDIKSSIMQFLDNNITIDTNTEMDIRVGKIDPRLQLRQCSKPLQPFSKHSGNLSGNITIGVRCSSPKPWTVYVPTEINIFEHVIVSAQPLARGQLISQGDIKIMKLRTSHNNLAYYRKPDNVIGMVLSRNISAGKVITPRLIQMPKLIKRGESVTLLAKTPYLAVRMKGKAMEDGTMGQLIKVRNISSNRVVEGIVAKASIVEVPM